VRSFPLQDNLANPHLLNRDEKFIHLGITDEMSVAAFRVG